MNANFREFLSQHMEVVERKTDIISPVFLTIFDSSRERAISYYDLVIGAGSFFELQQSDATQYIEVEKRYKNVNRYFACKVIGESMSKVIPNGAICLFEK